MLIRIFLNSEIYISIYHLHLNIFTENIKRKATYMQIKFAILSLAETTKLFIKLKLLKNVQVWANHILRLFPGFPSLRE